MRWLALNPAMRPENLGYLTDIFLDTDRRPAAEQADDRYRRGGGWQPQDGWTVNIRTGQAAYPGDPPIFPVAAAQLNDETLMLYPHDYLCIIQPDGSYQMARMD